LPDEIQRKWKWRKAAWARSNLGVISKGFKKKKNRKLFLFPGKRAKKGMDKDLVTQHWYPDPRKNGEGISDKSR